MIPPDAKIAFLINPAAGRVSAARAREFAGRMGRRVACIESEGPGHGERIASELARRGVETLVVLGGDGTINEAVNGLYQRPELGSRVRFAALPGGSLNVFCASHPLPSAWSQAWEWIESAPARSVDLGELQLMNRAEPSLRYFAQLGGGGLDGRALACVSPTLKRRFRSIAYAWAGVVALVKSRAKRPVSIGSHRWRAMVALVGLGQYYSRGLPLFAGADDSDGSLEYAVFPNVHLGTLARLPRAFFSRDPARVLGAVRGRVSGSDGIEVGSREEPAELEIDGEYLGLDYGRFVRSAWRLNVVDLHGVEARG